MSTNLVVSTNFGSLPTYSYPSGYDQTKLGLGLLMTQANDPGPEGHWVGPMPINVMRPVETASAMPCVMPKVINWSTTYDWVIFADNAAASLTRRFALFTFNKTQRLNPWSYQGMITCSMPSGGGTYTNRSHAVAYEKYTTGTVSINNGSNTLTGLSSTWAADRIFLGSRIGFGSTDPTQITKWYEIGAVGNDTTITLTQVFGESNISGSDYVIEDLRILFAMTNAIANLGGVFMAAGLRFENFTTAGFGITAATTVDKVRAIYWLNDGNAANNGTNQTMGGIVVDARESWTYQKYYALDCAALSSRFQVGNFRAPMTNLGTSSAGRDAIATGTFLFNTGSQAVSYAISQNDCLTLATLQHGPRPGVKSLFWVTASSIYCAVLTGGNVTLNSTYFQSGQCIEKPPGTIGTFAATAALSSLDYSTYADRFMVISSGATAFRHYVTQYREDAGQWDRIILTDTKQINQSIMDLTSAIQPALLSVAATACFSQGMCYLCTHGITAATNLVYNIPLAADWEYTSTSNSRVVLPVMTLSGFSSLVAGYFNSIGIIGNPANPMLGRTGTNLGLEPGAVRMFYRTSGFDTAGTGSSNWTLLDYSGDMSQVFAPTGQIQAMLEFRIMNPTCIPGRVTRVAFEGTGSISDSHFQFSQNLTNLASKQFAFRYSTAFGTTVPTLYIRIYDAVTNALLVTDNSASPTGTWEKTIDGGSNWTAFNTTDRANEITYFRYTPYSIADNVNVMPVVLLS